MIRFVLNLTANSTDRWWINAMDGGDKTFVRAGLWQICFDMYRHRFDYYGKIYKGCWWVFSPHLYRLRSWFSRDWFRWVETLSTLSLIIAFIAVITALLIWRKHDGFKSAKQVLTAATLHGLAGVFMFATVILFGYYGKRRDWMINWQFNWFGWSFKLAIVACILHFMTAFIAGYQGMNKYLYDKYDYKKIHEEVENPLAVKLSSFPVQRASRVLTPRQ